MGVNACENFIDAKGLFATQALVVLPLTDDDQSEAKAFVDWLRRQGKTPPYILGVGRCEAAQRKGLVAKMGLNDLITLPFDETVVQERLASFRRWCQQRDEKETGENAGQAVVREVPQVATMPAELLQTTRVSLFAGASGDDNEESPETIYCRETPVGIAMFDRDLRYVLANPRWVQQFRLQDKEIIGRSQFDIFPRLHPNWRKIYQRCLDGETRRGRETIDSGQGPLEMRWEVRPWHYLAGQIGGVTIAFEEVWKPADSDREAAKGGNDGGQSLRASRIEGPAVLLGVNGQMVEASPAAKALGMTEPGGPWLAGLESIIDDLPLTECLYHEDPETGRPGHLAWSNTVLRNPQGEVTGLLRVGVFLPETLLPVTAVEEKSPDPPAVSTFEARKLLHPAADAAPPEIGSFADEDLDEMPEMIWKANPRGEITFFNQAWLRFRARPLAAELNGGWLDGLHPADSRDTKAVVAEAIRRQTSLEHSFRLKSKEGHFLEIDMWVRPYHDQAGELSGFYGACRPHRPRAVPMVPPGEENGKGGETRRNRSLWPHLEKEAADAVAKWKEAEREISELKAALEDAESGALDAGGDSLFEAAPVMLWSCDDEGQLTAVNQQWESFRDKAASEELGDAWLEGIPSAEERQAIRDRLHMAAAQGQALECQFQWTDGGRETRLVEMQGKPRVDAEGSCQGLSGVLRDVTETHAALSAMRELVVPEGAGKGKPLVSELIEELSGKLPAWREAQTAATDLAAFREIFDHVAAGIVLLGSDSKPLFTNRRHRELLGFGIEDEGDMEGWLRRACNDTDHAGAVLKIWQEDIWRRQLTKVIALKTSKGVLRELKFEPQLFLDNNRLLLTLHDVTESKRAEEAMRESEIRFRALFRESSMGIALIGAEEKIYDINPALERLLGVPRRQLLCRHFDECVHGDDLPRKQARLKELLHSPKRSAQIELRLATNKDHEKAAGEETWVRLHISLVRDVDQRILFTAYFVQDITDQKRLQAELLISQEQNRALLEVIPDLILLVDTDGQVIDLMPGESMALDLDEENAIGGQIGDVIPAFAEPFESLISEAYQLDDVVHFRFPGAQGALLEARIVSCKPDNAVITIHHAPLADAPASRASAESLPPDAGPQVVQRRALTFHSAPGAIILTDYTGAIQDWNPAAEALFGYSKEEAAGQSMPALFGVDSLDALTRHLQQANGNRWAGEIPFRRKDRSEGRAKVMFLPLKSENGDVSAQAAFIREIDDAPQTKAAVVPDQPGERERLPEQLPQVHQRLRNNLQIISTLLNLQFKAQAPGVTREALRTSRNRAQALLLLHEHVGVEDGEETVRFASFATALGNHLLASFEAGDRVRLHMDIDDVLDLQAASPLALILSELLSNAIHHGFPAPETGSIHVHLKLDGGQGALTVSDDGVGLAQSAATPSGMGLQIVKTLASQIAGNLEKIDSTETEFRVYFRTSLRE